MSVGCCRECPSSANYFRAVAFNDMKTEAVLTQAVEQLERMNEALAALRRELLPGQSKKFAILAEGPLEDIRRLQVEIEQLTSDLAATPAGA
jgi:hypothetical protein